MSLMPANPGDPLDAPVAEPAAFSTLRPPPLPPKRLRWPYRSIWVILFSILALEIGLFLAIFPWMDYWTFNHLTGYIPLLEDYWDDPYLKGAISGLGCVNVYIATAQMASLARRRKPFKPVVKI